MSPRTALADAIRSMTSWRIVTADVALDTLNAPVVILKQQSFQRMPEAPLAYHIVDFTVTIASPLSDPVKAEDQLDEKTNELIHALDDAGILWSRAEKVQYDNRYVAYDITVHLESRKE